jgi:transposase
MLTRPSRWWLCTQATDMRRSFDGLSALVRHHLGRDPLDGAGFLFVNRRRTQLKVLYFDGDGFCVWSKRLEQGQFAVQPRARAGAVALSGTGFQALLEGQAGIRSLAETLSNPELDALRAENAALKAALAQVTQQREWFQRQLFGRKSERHLPVDPSQGNWLAWLRRPWTTRLPPRPSPTPDAPRRTAATRYTTAVCVSMPRSRCR